MNKKSALKSKTIIGGLMTVIPLVMQMAGIEPPTESEVQILGAGLQTLIEVGCEVVGLALVIWGRLTAKSTLTLK